MKRGYRLKSRTNLTIFPIEIQVHRRVNFDNRFDNPFWTPKLGLQDIKTKKKWGSRSPAEQDRVPQQFSRSNSGKSSYLWAWELWRQLMVWMLFLLFFVLLSIPRWWRGRLYLVGEVEYVCYVNILILLLSLIVPIFSPNPPIFSYWKNFDIFNGPLGEYWLTSCSKWKIICDPQNKTRPKSLH